MTVKVTEDGVEFEEVTSEEGVELLDHHARKYLNISGEEFLRTWDAGEFPRPLDPKVTHVAMLIPFAREERFG